MQSKEVTKSFNEHYHTLAYLINRKRKRFTLKAVPSLSFDDFFQRAITHLYLKFDKFNIKKGDIKPWAATLIENQWKNFLRDHYLSFKKPCSGCPYNDGDLSNPEACSWTKSGIKSGECSDYAVWQKKKENKYNIRLPLPLESHSEEVTNECADIDIEEFLGQLDGVLEGKLRESEYKLFRLLYIEKLGDEEAAKRMGWEIKRIKRRPKYARSMEMHKKKILEEAKKIIYEDGSIQQFIESDKIGGFLFEKPEKYEQMEIELKS